VLEQWRIGSSFACAGCEWLSQRGAFPAGILPEKLHIGCRCYGPWPVELRGMSPQLVVRLGLEAERNAADIDNILAEARRRITLPSTAQRLSLGG
jgi:hypothetical protein